jgi:5'-nucleotidase
MFDCAKGPSGCVRTIGASLKILVTNDDGIHSPGLWALADGLKDVGEVVVVAPDRDQSGIGSAKTLVAVVRVEEVPARTDGVKAFSVQGTPADCVILASESLFQERFDLVVSGINQGANLGLDIMSSGTVAGAMQGYFRNIPSIAVSVTALSDVKYEAAALTARCLAAAISRSSPSGPLLLNVNVPNVAPGMIEKVDITRLGPRAYMESVERGSDSRRTHYWIKQNRPTNLEVGEGTDIWAVRKNRVSITPVDLLTGPGEPAIAYDALAGEVAKELGLSAAE